eukprot:1418717-Pleurochrysis_carterae.AAC.1
MAAARGAGGAGGGTRGGHHIRAVRTRRAGAQIHVSGVLAAPIAAHARVSGGTLRAWAGGARG